MLSGNRCADTQALFDLAMSANALAKALNVPTPRINDVVRKRRGVSADTAMRLARYFGGHARSWLNLQTAYDLRIAQISNMSAMKKWSDPLLRSIVLYSVSGQRRGTISFLSHSGNG